MARYSSQLTSSAALAANGVIAYLGFTAVAFKLRRVSVGVIAGSGVPTSQQVQLGINHIIASAPVGAQTGAVTVNKMDVGSAAATNSLCTGYATTAPTLAASDQFSIAFNTQSAVDLPWELLEEFRAGAAPVGGTANGDGLAFVNRVNALPAAHSYVLSVEFEE